MAKEKHSIFILKKNLCFFQTKAGIQKEKTLCSQAGRCKSKQMKNRVNKSSLKVQSRMYPTTAQ